MKNPKLIFILAIALLIGILYLLPLWLRDGFGFDQLRYFSLTFAYAWSLAFFILAGIFFFLPLPRFLEKLNSGYLLAVTGLIWMAGLYFLRTSAPLLGDGLDRIISLGSALWPLLKSEPAPLDLTIHWICYQAMKNHVNANFLGYTLASYAAGIFYLVMVLVLVRRVFSRGTERILAALILLSPGYIQLFAGYAENYSFLPGLMLFWVIGTLETEKGRIRVLIISQVLLTLCNFLFLLILPATLYLLLTSPEKRIRFWAGILSLLGAVLGAISVGIAWKTSLGWSMFLTPERIFVLGHLIDFLNQQILASPAFPLLLAGLFCTEKGIKNSRPEKALLTGGVILVIFFFLVRTGIGATRDWDLLTLPAMLYTPFLVLYLFRRLENKQNLLVKFAIMVFLVSAFHTGAWLLLNHSEEKMIARIQFHLDENRERERWASAYGWTVLGRHYVLTGKINEAMNAFDKSIQIHPSYSQNRLIYGYHLWKLGRYQEAISELEMAHQINPTNPGIKKFLGHFYLEYARILLNANQINEAAKYLKKNFDLMPDWRLGLEALVDFYKNYLKDPEKARYYEQILKQTKNQEKP